MEAMSEQRWTELNAKLEAERAALTRSHESLNRRGSALAILAAVALLLAAAGITLAAMFFEEQAYYVGAPFAIPVALIGFLYLRAQRRAELARADVERLDRDLRQWKKRHP